MSQQCSERRNRTSLPALGLQGLQEKNGQGGQTARGHAQRKEKAEKGKGLTLLLRVSLNDVTFLLMILYVGNGRNQIISKQE